MILAAVIIGYVLGIAPFIVPKIIERIDKNKTIKIKEQVEEKEKEYSELLDEYLNGPKQEDPLINEPKQINQQEIYEEYVTGKVKGA